jgi:parvulin-like peptidyl-prolyl isomerase
MSVSFLLPAVLLLAAAGIFGCTGKEEDRSSEIQGRIIARVNDSVLLEEELNNSIPEFFGDLYSDGGKKEYVKQWVENELLYQKALEEGLQWDEEIQRKIVQFQHMLLEEEILRKHLDGMVRITYEDISEYYAGNIELFTQDENEYRLARLVLQSEEIARAVVEELSVAPERYDELIMEEAYRGKIIVVDLGFYPAGELAETFGDKIEEYGVGKVSQIVKTSPGSCYVLRIMEYREKGYVRELSEVEEQIQSVLLRTKSDKVKQEWINELKEEADIEIVSDYLDLE